MMDSDQGEPTDRRKGMHMDSLRESKGGEKAF